ncbi:MAG: 6-bladed beta-propeller, partial [Candidatus Nomurabacteria bacterium]|nr:6-bladed beta-propeller [Candidatus Nomurabacteria bacterium]
MFSKYQKHSILLHSLIVILLVFTGFSIFLINVKAFPSFTQDSVVASQGSSEGEVYFPMGLSVDSLGNLYVADGLNRRIEEFDSNGTFVKTFGWGVQDGSNVFQICTSGCRAGIVGNGNGQFNGYQLNISPFRLAHDSGDNLYVTDTSNNRIQKFDTNGNYLSQIGAGTLLNPFGIVVDSSNFIYVVDRGHARIVEFDSNGTFVKTFGWGVQDGSNVFQICTVGCTTGHTGSGDGQFNLAEGIALDSLGNIYVADTANNRIQKFDIDGNYLSQWGVNGYNDGEFSWPTSIKIDSSDNLYIFDNGAGPQRLQKFDTDGNFLSSSFGHPKDNFYFGTYRGDIAFSSDGGLYVSSTETGSGGLSNILKLRDTLTPEIDTITPNIKLLGDVDTTVDITGADFNPDVVVRFNGIDRNTTYVDSSNLTVDLDPADFLTIGTFPITAVNPTPLSVVSMPYDFNIIDGNTSAIASIYVGNVGGNDISGLPDAGYDFSYFSTATSGNLSSITITFPEGYIITDGDLTTASIYPDTCYYDWSYLCFNNTHIGVLSVIGDTINNTITISFNPIVITQPFNLSFSIATGIKNPTIAGTKPGLDFIFLDDISGSSPVHSISDVNILPGPLDHFSFENIKNHLINKEFNIVITAQDVFNNTVDMGGDTAEITSTGTMSSGSGTSVPFVGGVLTQAVKFSEKGEFTISANNWQLTNPATSNDFKISSPPSPIGQTCGNCPPPPPPDPCTLNPSSCIQKEIIKTCPEDPTKCPPPPQQ